MHLAYDLRRSCSLMQKIVAMYYSYMKATMDYIFSQLCIFFPRVSNKATRGKESQHLRLRIRTTWTWEEIHQMQKIVAMYYSYMKSYDGYIFSQLCIFFPRVSNKSTRGNESQHLRLRIRTTCISFTKQNVQTVKEEDLFFANYGRYLLIAVQTNATRGRIM